VISQYYLPLQVEKGPKLAVFSPFAVQLNAWNKETEAAQSAQQRDDRHFPIKF